LVFEWGPVIVDRSLAKKQQRASDISAARKHQTEINAYEYTK
jgi:hypothetical protein